MLIPYGVLAEQSENTSVSAFAFAFQRNGMKWAAYVVSACASLGIITNVGISASLPAPYRDLDIRPHSASNNIRAQLRSMSCTVTGL